MGVRGKSVQTTCCYKNARVTKSVYYLTKTNGNRTMKIKSLLCTIGLLFASCISAQTPPNHALQQDELCCKSFAEQHTWMEDYQEAVKVMKTDSYESYLHLCDAINGLQNRQDDETLFLFLERGSLLLNFDYAKEGLDDINHIIATLTEGKEDLVAEGNKLPIEKRNLLSSAIFERARHYAKIDDNESMIDDIHAALEINPQKSGLEYIGNNTMMSKSFPIEKIDEYKTFFTETGLVESEDDVVLSPAGVLTVKMKSFDEQCDDCCGSCGEGGLCEGDKKEKGPKTHKVSNNGRHADSATQNCENSCASIAGQCYKVVMGPDARKTSSSYETIFSLERSCYACCRTRGGAQSCLQPLFKELEKIQREVGNSGSGESRYGTSFRSDSPLNPHRDTFRVPPVSMPRV